MAERQTLALNQQHGMFSHIAAISASAEDIVSMPAAKP